MTGIAPGTLRIWDGSAWRLKPESWAVPAWETIKEGATSVIAASTTTCSRTPSTIHKGASVTLTASTTGRNGGNIEFYYYSSAGAWVKFATKAAPTAGGNVSVTHAPGYSVNYYAKFTGSTTHKASSSASAGVVTVQTQKTATVSRNVTWVAAYTGAGGRISGSTGGADSAVHQGYYSSLYGNRKSAIRFVPALPSGAVVTKVVLDCNSAWSHWYSSVGGTIVVGWHTDTSASPDSTWAGATRYVNKSTKAVNKPSWDIDITSWAASVVGRADFGGITLGPGLSTSTGYYGYSIPAPSGTALQLHISYSYWS